MEKEARESTRPGRPSAPKTSGLGELHLTHRERHIVKLLAAGCTDEVAARELKISRRTVCYVVQGLMARMNAGSRFQLAWLLRSTACEG